jgi:acyl-CoA thioesterase YciA
MVLPSTLARSLGSCEADRRVVSRRKRGWLAAFTALRRRSRMQRAPRSQVGPRGELASRTLAMPANTNPRGDMFGGWIMSLMDAAAAMTATARARGSVVTASVSNITFLRPMKVGDTVCCYTDVSGVGRTSLTLCVEVWVLREGQGDRIKVTEAEFTFVAINENGRPRRLART